MAKSVGDRFDRGIVSQRSNRPRMTQSARTGAGRLYTSSLHMAPDNIGDGQSAEWPEWSLISQEYFSERDFRTPVTKIFDDRFSHRWHERQHHFFSSFLSPDPDSRVLPIDVVQKQFGRRDAPNPVSHH